MKVQIVLHWLLISIALIVGVVAADSAIGALLPPVAASVALPWRQGEGEAPQAENPPAAPTPVTTAPTVGQEPRRVKVNFFVNSIRNIDDDASAYDVDMYLDLFWDDPALAGKTVADLDTAALWDPYLDLTNADSVDTLFQIHDDSLEADSNIRLSYRLAGTYLGRFDLHKFPFDQQTLSIDLGSFQYDSSQVLFDYFRLDQPVVHSERPYVQIIPIGRHISPDVVFDQWTLTEARIVQQINLIEYDKSSWSQFKIELVLVRHAAAYLWKIVLVLVLLMALAWGILLIDPDTLHFRLLVLFTLLLATVTFDFTTLNMRPQLPYLTFIDLYFITAYGAFMVIAAAVFLMPIFLRTGRGKLAQRLNRLMLLLYPLLLVGASGILFWYGLS